MSDVRVDVPKFFDPVAEAELARAAFGLLGIRLPIDPERKLTPQELQEQQMESLHAALVADHPGGTDGGEGLAVVVFQPVPINPKVSSMALAERFVKKVKPKGSLSLDIFPDLLKQYNLSDFSRRTVGGVQTAFKQDGQALALILGGNAVSTADNPDPWLHFADVTRQQQIELLRRRQNTTSKDSTRLTREISPNLSDEIVLAARALIRGSVEPLPHLGTFALQVQMKTKSVGKGNRHREYIPSFSRIESRAWRGIVIGGSHGNLADRTEGVARALAQKTFVQSTSEKIHNPC